MLLREADERDYEAIIAIRNAQGIPWPEEEQIDDPSTLAEAYQVVLHGDRWIGLKEVGKGAAPGSVACGLMAVAPEFRRRGLARVMQRKTIEYAKRTGCAALKSCTATCNVPMLELYASLGYRRLYEWSQHMMEV